MRMSCGHENHSVHGIKLLNHCRASLRLRESRERRRRKSERQLDDSHRAHVVFKLSSHHADDKVIRDIAARGIAAAKNLQCKFNLHTARRGETLAIAREPELLKEM